MTACFLGNLQIGAESLRSPFLLMRLVRSVACPFTDVIHSRPCTTLQCLLHLTALESLSLTNMFDQKPTSAQLALPFQVT
jgi:hypothetical protein